MMRSGEGGEEERRKEGDGDERTRWRLKKVMVMKDGDEEERKKSVIDRWALREMIPWWASFCLRVH